MLLCLYLFTLCFTGSLSEEGMREIRSMQTTIYATEATIGACQTIASIAILFSLRLLRRTIIHRMEHLIESNMIPLLPQTIGATSEPLERALESFLATNPEAEIV